MEVKRVPRERSTASGMIGEDAWCASMRRKRGTVARPIAMGMYWMVGEERPKRMRTMEAT